MLNGKKKREKRRKTCHMHETKVNLVIMYTYISFKFVMIQVQNSLMRGS